MSIIDTVRNLFTTAQASLPDNLDSLDEIKAKATELSAQHGETINGLGDKLKEQIPGENDDKFIGGVQDQVTKLAEAGETSK